jgi:hypothetical protein
MREHIFDECYALHPNNKPEKPVTASAEESQDEYQDDFANLELDDWVRILEPLETNPIKTFTHLISIIREIAYGTLHDEVYEVNDEF